MENGNSAKAYNKKRIATISVATVTTLAIIGGAVAWGVNASETSKTEQARTQCFEQVDEQRVEMNLYNNLHNGGAANAAEIKDNEVADKNTVQELKSLVEEKAPKSVACNVSARADYEEHAEKAKDNASWYKQHTGALQKAVDAVNDSHEAKLVKDAQDRLAKKVDEAKKLVKSSDKKVKDNTTRDNLNKQIAEAEKAKTGKDTAKLDEQSKKLDELSRKVNDSIKAKQEADRKAKEEKERKEREAREKAEREAAE